MGQRGLVIKFTSREKYLISRPKQHIVAVIRASWGAVSIVTDLNNDTATIEYVGLFKTNKQQKTVVPLE